MPSKVLLKKSSVAAKVPLVTDLDYGELAINYADNKLYYKTATNTINAFTTNTGTVTSVNGTGSYGGLTLSGTVTTSGNLTLGGTPTGNWPISVTGNATTATSWQTARTFTIGATGKSVDGSANVSWSVAEVIGYTPVQQGGGTGQGTNKVYVGWLGSQLGLQIDVTNFGATWPINVTGNAATAAKLATARTINGVSFDGTANINIATKLVVLSRASTQINVSIANAILAITNRAGSTINVSVS